MRKVCPACARPRAPSREEVAFLGRFGLRVRHLLDAAGCEACGGTGFKGRTAIVEVFAVDETIEDMILRGESTAVLGRHLARMGFVGLLHAGLRKAVHGVTTPAEVQSVVMD